MNEQEYQEYTVEEQKNEYTRDILFAVAKLIGIYVGVKVMMSVTGADFSFAYFLTGGVV